MLINKYRNKICLLFILAIALVLRLYKIDQPFIDTLSWRQTSTAMMAENFYKTNPNIFYPQINWSGPGPSYNGREFQTVSYITALLYHIFGQQDWIGRLVSVVFGIWGIFALYKLVSRVWDETHALASAFMMAVLPLSILVDRSFIPDPAMVSLVVTSLWLFIAYLQTDTRRYLILSAIFGCLGFLTKLPGMIVGLPALYAFFHISKARLKLTSGKIREVIIAGGITVILVLSYYLWARHLSLTYPPYHFAGEGNWVWNEGLLSWIRNKYFLSQLFLIAEWEMLGLLVIAIFVLGIFFYPPSSKKNSREIIVEKSPYFFHFWLLAFAFFYVIGAKELIANFWNFHILSPVIAVFAGRTIILIFHIQPKFGVLAYARLVIIGISLMLSGFFTMKHALNEEVATAGYRMAKALKEIKKEGDLVVTLPEISGDPYPIYYSQCQGWTFPPLELNGKFYETSELPNDDQESIKIIELLRSKKAVWFAIVQKQYNFIQTNQPAFFRYLNQNFPVTVKTSDYVIFNLKAYKSHAVNSIP